MGLRNYVVTLVLVLALVTTALVAVSVTAKPAQADAPQTYVVLYKAQSVPNNAAATIAAAGGTLVCRYDAIGVAIARSGNAAFRSNLMQDNCIEGVSSTAGFGTQVNEEVEILGASGVAACSWCCRFDS